MTHPTGFDCARAHREIHDRLDGEPSGTPSRPWLDRHLAACADCRRFGEDLHRIQDALQGMRRLELPGAALQEVWERTTGADAHHAPARSRRAWVRVAMAAAAVLVLVLAGVWTRGSRQAGDAPAAIARHEPTNEELRQAADQARIVLGLTAHALRKTERAAIHDVLGGDVSDALQRLPVHWPSAGAAGARESEL